MKELSKKLIEMILNHKLDGHGELVETNLLENIESIKGVKMDLDGRGDKPTKSLQTEFIEKLDLIKKERLPTVSASEPTSAPSSAPEPGS